jgi:hypothetical protein
MNKFKAGDVVKIDWGNLDCGGKQSQVEDPTWHARYSTARINGTVAIVLKASAYSSKVVYIFGPGYDVVGRYRVWFDNRALHKQEEA